MDSIKAPPTHTPGCLGKGDPGSAPLVPDSSLPREQDTRRKLAELFARAKRSGCGKDGEPVSNGIQARRLRQAMWHLIWHHRAMWHRIWHRQRRCHHHQAIFQWQVLCLLQAIRFSRQIHLIGKQPVTKRRHSSGGKGCQNLITPLARSRGKMDSYHPCRKLVAVRKALSHYLIR